MPSLFSRRERKQDVEQAGDCLECRLIGTGAMLSVSAYFAYFATGANAAWTSHRKFSAAMSVCFALAGVARFVA
jgi:hypothetical protein